MTHNDYPGSNVIATYRYQPPKEQSIAKASFVVSVYDGEELSNFNNLTSRTEKAFSVSVTGQHEERTPQITQMVHQ